MLSETECAHRKAKVDVRALDANDEKVDDVDEKIESNGDGECDDAVWILRNICDGAAFAERSRFALKSMFAEASDEWFERFAANAKWKGVLGAWWIFTERCRANTKHSISAQCMRGATKTVHALLTDDESDDEC